VDGHLLAVLVDVVGERGIDLAGLDVVGQCLMSG
jgi:hypothetical protein